MCARLTYTDQGSKDLLYLLMLLLSVGPSVYGSELDIPTSARWYPPPPSHSHEIKPVEDPLLLMAERVSYCESGNRNAENPVSSASGYFQFISSTWTNTTQLPPPASLYSYEVQLEAFLKLWDNGAGSFHWAPSESCWKHEDPWNHYDR